jgi:hypothetical protein
MSKLNAKNTKLQLFAFWMCDSMLKNNIINNDTFDLFMKFIKIKDAIDDQNLLYDSFFDESKNYSKAIKTYISGKLPEKARNKKKIVVEDKNPDLIRQVVGVANLDEEEQEVQLCGGAVLHEENITRNTTPIIPEHRIPIINVEETKPAKKPRAKKNAIVAEKPARKPRAKKPDAAATAAETAADVYVMESVMEIAAEPAAATADEPAADVYVMESVMEIEAATAAEPDAAPAEVANKKRKAKKIIPKPNVIENSNIDSIDSHETTKPVKKPRAKKTITNPDIAPVIPTEAPTHNVKKPRTKKLPKQVLASTTISIQPEPAAAAPAPSNDDSYELEAIVENMASLQIHVNDELDFEVISDRIDNVDDYNNNVQLTMIDNIYYLVHNNGSVYHSTSHVYIGQLVHGKIIVK